MMELLVTQSEIAAEFGVSRQAVHKWYMNDAIDFPRPRRIVLKGSRETPLFSMREVKAWRDRFVTADRRAS